jgi:hypothetical protein
MKKSTGTGESKAETKYGKYILTDLKPGEYLQKILNKNAGWEKRLAWLDGDVIKGAFYVTCAWYMKVPQPGAMGPHTHEFDEVIGYFGSDTENPRDLGGEIEFWLGDEPHTLKNSCLIYIPRGLPHCPVTIKRIDKPIFHITVGSGDAYVKENVA